MKKRIASAVMIFCFVVGVAGSALAARVECMVESVEEDMVTLKCEDADKFSKGDELKIRTPRRGAAIEGC